MIQNPSIHRYFPCSILPISFLFILGFSQIVLAQSSKINELRQAFYQSTLSNPEKLDASLTLAQSFRLFSTDSVLKYATTAQQLAEQLKDTSALAESYRQLGWSRGLMQQNIAQLIQDVLQAKSLAEQVNDSVKIVQAGLDLSRGFLAAQKMQEAQQLADLGLDYADRHGLDDLRFDALTAQSYMHILSDLGLSLEYRRQAFTQASANKDTVGMAVSLSQMASIMKFLKSDSVEYYLQAAKALFRLKQAPVYEGILLFNLAEYYGDLGYSDSLLMYGLRADTLAQQTNYVQISRVVKGLLFAYYFNRNQYKQAAPFARQALSIEQQRPSVNIVSAYVDFARVMAALNKADSAEYYFQESIKALDMVKSPRLEVFARMYYGAFLKEQGNYGKADEQLQQAKSLSSQTGAAMQDFLLLQLAETAYYNERFAEAKSYYQQAIELGDTKNEADLLSEGYQGMARCDSALGNWRSALMNQQLYQQWNDSLQRRAYNKQTAEMQTRFESLEKEAKIVEQELRIEQTRTERNYLIGLAVVMAVAGALVIGLLLRLRKRNEEISSQRERLAQLNESKDRLFAMIAHDLRGPVTGFQSTGKIIDHYVQKGEHDRLASIGKRIDKQSNQLRQLLDNLLNWSLQQLGMYEARVEAVNIHGLGSDILSRFEEQAEAKGNVLELEVAEELQWNGDRNGLSVILYNLVGNAIKFTEKGSIRLSAQQTAQEIIISVKDTGTGMTPDQLDSLMNEHTLDSQVGTAGEKGTGLGFQIVHQLLSYWEGRIEIDSSVGEGTNISICLPIRSTNR